MHSLEGRFICNHKSAGLVLGTNIYLEEQRFKLCIKQQMQKPIH